MQWLDVQKEVTAVDNLFVHWIKIPELRECRCIIGYVSSLHFSPDNNNPHCKQRCHYWYVHRCWSVITQERRFILFWWYKGAQQSNETKPVRSWFLRPHGFSEYFFYSITPHTSMLAYFFIGEWGWQIMHCKRGSGFVCYLLTWCIERCFVVPNEIDPECMYTKGCSPWGCMTAVSWLHPKLHTLTKKKWHNNRPL